MIIVIRYITTANVPFCGQDVLLTSVQQLCDNDK